MNKSFMKELIEAKEYCGEESDCSECIFGQDENICYLQDLQIDNNGWISCSERLPEESIEVLVSVREVDGDNYTTTSWVQEGIWVIKKTPLIPTVIAWQPLPEPYKECES